MTESTSAPTAPARTALVAGASGLVGGALLDALLARPEYGRVVALVRRALAREGAGDKLEQREVDFDSPEASLRDARADDVFCCLGTTIKKAGSQEAFRRVDLDYPLALARAAKAMGAKRFLIVTAVGADPASRVFYNRVKGEAEARIRELALPALDIFRPSMLAGDRTESRPGERIGLTLMRAAGPLIPARYRPIEGARVARAMVAAALGPAEAVRVHESEQIAREGA
jgi:uncharacterized protein YbjT (DUF2867 family)